MFKRAAVFIFSCTLIIFIMSEVLREPPSQTVFSPAASRLTVIDEESLLPIADCDIIIISDGTSHKTDSSGSITLSGDDLSLIAYKEGYAPHILLHEDISKDPTVISLIKREQSSFTSALGSDYAQRLLENYLDY